MKIKAGAYLYKEGPVNEGKVDLIIRDTVLHISHSHYDGKMFSEDDLSVAWSFQRVNLLVDSVFTLAVSTNAGTSYVITIDDPAKFLAFGNYYFETEGNISELVKKYHIDYKVEHFSLAKDNEKRFLELIKDENIGITLLKANETFTGYDKLILTRNGVVVPVPCN